MMLLARDEQAGALPTLRSSISPAGMNEREYAAQQLLVFLKQVGPVEAVWAMTTALEPLLALPHDHVAAAAAALDESIADAPFSEPAPTPEPTAPPAATDLVPEGDGPPADETSETDEETGDDA